MTTPRSRLVATAPALAVAAFLAACNGDRPFHEPNVVGYGAVTGELASGMECPGPRHPSGLPYIRQIRSVSITDFGVCPGERGHAEAVAARRDQRNPRTTPDLPRAPVVLPGGTLVRP